MNRALVLLSVLMFVSSEISAVYGQSLQEIRTENAKVIAVLGTGRMGGAIGPRLAEMGHTVVYGSREPEREDVVELVAKTGSSRCKSIQYRWISCCRKSSCRQRTC